MILMTKRDPGRRHVRVNEPIVHKSAGWNNEIGHYVDLYFQGSDKTAYTIRIVAGDVDSINRLWEDAAETRTTTDRELGNVT